MNKLKQEAIELLKEIITIPSFSRSENGTADLIEKFFTRKEIKTFRHGNNVWCMNSSYDDRLPSILLNSHHDTVQPNCGYTVNPFEPIVQEGKLYGLGSNDAGGSLVSLIAAFMYFYSVPDLKYNLIFSATAEEEISGKDGVASILDKLPDIEFGIVGEPTLMNLAIAEKGLLVVDCVSHGTSSHAAHGNQDNAILNAISDIQWFRAFHFPEISTVLGEVKMSVTLIKSGIQHNIIPDKCKFTVDIRTTECYTNQEVLGIIRQNVICDVVPRSLNLNSSSIDIHHPFVQAGILLGRSTYGSPTGSDMALMNFPTVKIGPGDSFRSHTGDEFIFIEEIENAIELYIGMLSKIV